MIHKTLLAMHERALFRDWLYRWLVVAATAVVAGIGLLMIISSVRHRKFCSSLLRRVWYSPRSRRTLDR
jgi:hypothetical protein